MTFQRLGQGRVTNLGLRLDNISMVIAIRYSMTGREAELVMSDDSNLLVSIGGNHSAESDKSSELGEDDQYEVTIAVDSTRECLAALCVYHHRGASHCEFYHKSHQLLSEDPLEHQTGNAIVALRHWRPIMAAKEKTQMVLLSDSQGLMSILNPSARELRRFRASLEAQENFACVIDLRTTPSDNPYLVAIKQLSRGDAGHSQNMYHFYSAVEKVLPECKFRDVSDSVDVRGSYQTWRALRRKLCIAAIALGLLLILVLIIYGFTSCKS